RSELTGITKGFLKDVTWGGSDTQTISYLLADASNMQGAVFGDRLQVTMRTAVIPWIEFKTPVVVRGRYKVWVGWRQNGPAGGGNVIDTYLNGEKLSRSLTAGEYRIRTLPDRELEALGYKKHVAGNLSGVNNYNCKMVGIVDVEITDRQTLRFETNTNVNAQFWLDFIQFIPIDEEQIYPQFDTNGNAVYP